jgi:predicted O-methyltransferase YrrM
MRLKTRAWQRFRLWLPKFYFERHLADLLLERLEPYIYFDRWFIQPFNGQAQRLKTITALARSFNATNIVETGTFLGSSTPYLASLVSGKTFTIEINSDTAKLTKKRFDNNHSSLDIDLIVGDSAIEIERVLSKLDPSFTRIIAYLDAHWLDAIPTSAELLALCKWGGPWLAIIDDFQVEADNGYGFDKYENTVIGKNLVPKNFELRTFVPSQTSKVETGRRKGTGYIFNHLASKIINPQNFPELCEIPTE